MDFLSDLPRHNNWANEQLIDVCYELTDQQLDAKLIPTFEWGIRQTLTHLVTSQHGYLSLLTLTPEQRQRPSLSMADLKNSAADSGEGILTLIHAPNIDLSAGVQTTDGYFVKPWIVITQVVNHASEHRQQICRMLRILDITPPNLDGWTFGEVTRALIPDPK